MDYGNAITVVGLKEAQATLAKAKSRMGSAELSFKRSAAVIDGWIQRNFREEGGKVGGWAPLADSTIESRMRRRNKTGAIRILQDTGTLRMKWKHTWSKNHVAVVSAVEYGIFHETGTSKMPQRRILPTMEEIWPSIEKLFDEHIRRALKP